MQTTTETPRKAEGAAEGGEQGALELEVTDTNRSAAVHPDADAEASEAVEATADDAEGTAQAADDETADSQDPVDAGVPDRRRIEEQLQALKRREFELRRELAMADHPDLAEGIRVLESCVYSVNRAEAKLAQGLTKSEERRQETLGKKIASLTEKRDVLDAQIAELQQELSSLGEERITGYRLERKEAMMRLVAALGKHGSALSAADLEPVELLPQVGEWMGEIRAVAEELAATRR